MSHPELSDMSLHITAPEPHISLPESAGKLVVGPPQEAGEARKDVDFDDVLRMVSGLTGAVFVDESQRERVLEIALEGVRASR